LLIPGPTAVDIDFTWNIAVWAPTFTNFLHTYLHESKCISRQQGTMAKSEVTMGVALKAALDQGLRLEAVQFSEDWYLDIGTPDNLVKAVRQFSS
jgi:glucose-1-phosphate thymidylyltransferase